MLKQVKERIEELQARKTELEKTLATVEEEIRSLIKQSLREDYGVIERKSLVRFRGRQYLVMGLYEMEPGDRKPWLIGRVQKGKKLGPETLLYDEWELIDL